eukprot:g371.t1
MMAVLERLFAPGLSCPALPTPDQVLLRLVKAFGAEKVGETGYDLAATRCLSDAEKNEARRRGSSLLYGEMLPDGVSKALHVSRLGEALREGSMVLELGMGSGTVAMQIFLQSASVRKVVGVEIVRSRYMIAEAALQRLANEEPHSFRITEHISGQRITLEEATTGRSLQCHCADFFSMGLDLVQNCDVIFFAVNIPWKLFQQLCQRLTEVKEGLRSMSVLFTFLIGSEEGCRLFTYHRLDTVWWTEDPCPFHQVEVNIPETDTFSTSWSPHGFRFYVYVCDRKRESSIKADVLNETQPRPSGLCVSRGASDESLVACRSETEGRRWKGSSRYPRYEGFVYKRKNMRGLRLRLARWGSKHKPFYRIHAVWGKQLGPRMLGLQTFGWSGRFNEICGFYDPLREFEDPRAFTIRADRCTYWLRKGAQPTDQVANLLDIAGIIRRTGQFTKKGEWEWRIDPMLEAVVVPLLFQLKKLLPTECPKK